MLIFSFSQCKVPEQIGKYVIKWMTVFEMLLKYLLGAFDMHIKFTLKWVVKFYQEFSLNLLLVPEYTQICT